MKPARKTPFSFQQNSPEMQAERLALVVVESDADNGIVSPMAAEFFAPDGP